MQTPAWCYPLQETWLSQKNLRVLKTQNCCCQKLLRKEKTEKSRMNSVEEPSKVKNDVPKGCVPHNDQELKAWTSLCVCVWCVCDLILGPCVISNQQNQTNRTKLHWLRSHHALHVDTISLLQIQKSCLMHFGFIWTTGSRSVSSLLTGASSSGDVHINT